MLATTIRKRARERHEGGDFSPMRQAAPLDDHEGPSSPASSRHFKEPLPSIRTFVVVICSCLTMAVLISHWLMGAPGGALSLTTSRDTPDRRRTKGSPAQLPPLQRIDETSWYPRVAVYTVSTATLISNTTSGQPRRKHKRSRWLRYPMSRAEPTSSKDYQSGQAEPLETDQCKPNVAWQTLQYPTCNSIHELSLAGPFSRTMVNATDGSVHDLIRMVNNGFWRDVWVVPDFNLQRRVIKTIRYEHEFTARNIERNRRDAMALERLTSSRHVVDVYGYCSTSAFFEFSDGGDINNELWSDVNMTSIRKLQIATQAAMGLADAHTVDFEDRATIAHTDVAGNQYILIDGFYKLNDFNRARFLLRNKTSDANCPYVVGKNPGKNRSPEEYRYDPQSEKVDVYSFGNILYTLLQREYPFEDVSSKTARRRVVNGQRPAIFVDVWNSTDPAIQALKRAMIMCHVQNQTERASMRQVETFLKRSLQAIDPGRLQEWGEA